MAKCYICPHCGDHLDHGEQYTHKCQVIEPSPHLFGEAEQKHEKADAAFVERFMTELRKKVMS